MLFFIIGEVGKVPLSFAVLGIIVIFSGVAAALIGINKWAKKNNQEATE
jgi:hypothetical protein